MKADKTERPCRAMYRINWFDVCWNQLGSTQKLLTAHELFVQMESWNLACQRIAKDNSIVITPVDHPAYVSVEVCYVEA